jgi:phosphoglucosamine mutase
MKRLFGTDGVRAAAGQYPLDDATVWRLGHALARTITAPSGREGAPRILIGRDTRESGPGIQAAFSAGAAAGGAIPVSTGVITTPGVAFLTRTGGFAAGAVISASHNPYHDNGIKLLGPNGMKLPDFREATLEEMVLDDPAVVTDARVGLVPPLLEDPAEPLLDSYRRHLSAAAGGTGALEGLHVVLDCARGAAYRTGPEVFRGLGARVEAIGCDPDGRNINEGCGSLHLERLAEAVVRSGAALGLAFDGDADRCLLVDRTGRALDGDFVLYVQALRLARRGLLRGGQVVATVMTNLWLEKALAAEGIGLLRTQVGDKYVLERMITENAALGGEQSGHVIFLDVFPAGDGLLTGLLMALAVTEGNDLAELAAGVRRYPQVLINVKVRTKPQLEVHDTIGPALRRAEERLAGDGRVLVRYSGTEPLARVMIEGTDEGLVQGAAEELARVIRTEIGA